MLTISPLIDPNLVMSHEAMITGKPWGTKDQAMKEVSQGSQKVLAKSQCPT
jgi:hypothetical protein